MSSSSQRAASVSKTDLGPLPEWNLNDLYPAIDSPEVAADLVKGDAECIAFEETYKGKLAEIAAAPDAGEKLAIAIRRFEAIEDLLGRLISYAGLVYTGDTTDPKRAKFYGDVQERITTASSHLLFFTLELNRIDDALIEKALQNPAFGHYRPWIEDVRKERP
ncbi:MAG TPA: oligoendopeptidase F, partial [Xanthobacteraceae bacterium]|nr:oligoendopeptidase F [Xanthobacteraceae bacterium]